MINSASVSKDGRNVRTRGHPSRRAQGRAPQDEVGDIFTTYQDEGSLFTPASVRAAIRSASTSNADASRNGAPGNFTGACGLMNQAKVSVNRNGPTSCDTLCTLDVAPCNWPCWSGATNCVVSAWIAAPAMPHNDITGMPSRSEERRVGKEGRFRWSPNH